MAEKKAQPGPGSGTAGSGGSPPPTSAPLETGTTSGDADIDHLLKARSEIDTALGRHKAQLAVVFTDIVGSTAFFEKFGDTAGLMMLQRHHELVLPAIEEGRGTVIKTIGDAVLATFGSAEQAVRAAIALQMRLEAFNEDRTREEQIHTRVGINYGTGFVKDKDLFGDVVNTAARFVKACEPAQILVSRSVVAALPKATDINFRPLGSVSMHGKAEAEQTFEIIWTTSERYDRVRTLLQASPGGKTTKNQLGRYEIMEEIGKGAMGVVYKAYDPAVGRIIALKTVRFDVAGPDRDELIRRLRQEAQAAGRLEHPNIVTIYDAGEIEGLFYIAMQFLKGRTLAEMIAERAMLPVEQIVLIVDQICDGLHYAHERGIIHRDLKPSNILITTEGAVKILDFGIAKVAEVGTTKAGMILGTPSYMSPEQARGGRIDRRADIFSLGAILYELLTGEKPFPGNTPTTIIYKILHEEPIPVRVIEPAVNLEFDRIVRKALSKSPFERYEDCQELRVELKAIASSDAAQQAKKAARLPSAAVRPKGPRPARKAAAPQPEEQPAPPPVAAAPPRRSALGPVLAIVAVLAVGAAAAGWQLGWFGFIGGQPRSLGTAPPAVSPPAKSPAPAPSGGGGTAPPAEQPAAGTEKPAEPASVGTTPPKPAAEKPAPISREAKESRRSKRAAEKTESPKQEPAEEKAAASQPPAPATEKPKSTAPATGRAQSPEQQLQIARWFRQAERYVGQGKYAEAAVQLEEILKIDPSHVGAKDLLGKVRQMQQIPK